VAQHTVADLAAEIVDLGVRQGDLLMVHASLRKLGEVEGRAAGVVEALDRAVGPRGNLMMVLGAKNDFAWVNERPGPFDPALLADAPAFDHLRTPADPVVGMLAEVFRRLPGTVAGDHPDGRFAARGPLAHELVVRDLPWDDYYGPRSPLARLVAAGGKVLRLGADLNTLTLLHHAEYLADVANKRRVVRHHKVLRGGEGVVRSLSALDDSLGIAAYDGDYFADLLSEYLASGRASRGRVGSAAAELLDGPDVVRFATLWMSERLGKPAAERL